MINPYVVVITASSIDMRGGVSMITIPAISKGYADKIVKDHMQSVSDMTYVEFAYSVHRCG